MSQTPVRFRPPETKLPFPFSARPLMAAWNGPLPRTQYVHRQRDAKRANAESRRVFVNGLGHCSACHTPRNAFGAEKAARPSSAGGARKAGKRPHYRRYRTRRCRGPRTSCSAICASAMRRCTASRRDRWRPSSPISRRCPTAIFARWRRISRRSRQWNRMSMSPRWRGNTKRREHDQRRAVQRRCAALRRRLRRVSPHGQRAAIVRRASVAWRSTRTCMRDAR